MLLVGVVLLLVAKSAEILVEFLLLLKMESVLLVVAVFVMAVVVVFVVLGVFVVLMVLPVPMAFEVGMRWLTASDSLSLKCTIVTLCCDWRRNVSVHSEERREQNGQKGNRARSSGEKCGNQT